jgi:predicted NAD/FAD-binding protein
MSFAFHCDPQQLPQRPCGATLRSYALAAKDPSGAYCITEGVESYIHSVHQKLRNTHVMLNAKVISVCKNPLTGMWDVTSVNGETLSFNDIIFAAWPNQVADMLSANRHEQSNDALGGIIQHLSGIKRAYCRAIVHNDKSVMPADKINWVTYCYKHSPLAKNVAATIWSGQVNNTSIFTTYDWAYSPSSIPENNISGEISAVNVHFRTPPDPKLNAARDYIRTSQGTSNLWFTGSYLRNTGFHEDGLVSALEVVRLLEPVSISFPRLKGLMDELRQHEKNHE